MMKVVILVVALLTALCAGQLTQSEQDTLLALHNNARASASPVPASPLQSIVWDSAIAADAQAWTNLCNINYSPAWAATKYGENPFYFTHGWDVSYAFSYWMSQKSYYSFEGRGSCSSPYGCINFQQIVAANTYAMGCGKSVCNIKGRQLTWFVCDYKSYWQYNALPYTPAGRPPTGGPTRGPTAAPTAPPTAAPTAPPTAAPTKPPGPTAAPTPAPTRPPGPTPAPTSAPTPYPTPRPSPRPTNPPATMSPTVKPTAGPTPAPTPKPTSSSGYPSIDYRGTNLVTAVHDQGQCGSCWAFSTTAIYEGAVAQQTGTKPVMFSDQDTLDCSGGGGDCDHGGWPVNALKGMIKQGHINSQAAYPYETVQRTCRYNTAAGSVGTITQTGTVRGDFASLYNALVTYGPIGIAVDANSWSYYRSGVKSLDSTSINHAVTIVGYDASQNAWIVKNSWGATWGQSGYIYLDAAHPCGAEHNGGWWAK